MDNYDFINNNFYNLKQLYIINPYDKTKLDISLLSSCINLEKVYLENCYIINVDMIKLLKKCVELSLLDSILLNIDKDLHFLQEMPQLKILFISEAFAQNKNILSLSKNVEINYDIFKNDVE